MAYQRLGFIENVKKDKALLLQRELMQKYGSQLHIIHTPEEVSEVNPEILLVAGGDGFLLYTLHHYAKFNLPFYGINCGTVGFLLNQYNPQVDLVETLQFSIPSTIFPLKNTLVDVKGHIYVDDAFNELSLLRNTHQAIRVCIRVNGIIRVERLIADGLVVSTPLGSTSYNYSLGGPILPLTASLISVMPNSTFRPRFWRGALLSFNDVVQLDILDAEERSLNATLDYQEYRDIQQIKCHVDQTRSTTLLFNRDLPLTEKTVREQFADVFYTQNFLNNTNEF